MHGSSESAIQRTAVAVLLVHSMLTFHSERVALEPFRPLGHVLLSSLHHIALRGEIQFLKAGKRQGKFSAVFLRELQTLRHWTIVAFNGGCYVVCRTPLMTRE